MCIQAVRIGNLAHSRYSGWEANLLRAHSCCCSSNRKNRRPTRNLPAATEESICESHQVHVLRQSSLKYTSAQSRSVPRLAVPNSRPRAIRQWTPANRLAGRQMRVRCAQRCLCTIAHRRDSAARWSLPFNSIVSPGVEPIRGANRSKRSTTGSHSRREQPYPQFVLKTGGMQTKKS